MVTMTWLIATEYLCHKWLRLSSISCNYYPVLISFVVYRWVCNKTNTTNGTVAAPPGALDFTPDFLCGFDWFLMLIPRFLVLCFVDRCLSFCHFSFDHCIVCPSIYGFYLPLRYFQSCLNWKEHNPVEVHLEVHSVISSVLTYPRV